MFYILKSKKTGAILKCEVKDTSGGEYCGNVSYTLNEKKGMMFIANSENQAKEVLRRDSEWYNSSAEHPCHGSISINDIEIVKLVYAIE